jgi:hypothetical protein
MYNNGTAIHTGKNDCITTPLPEKMHRKQKKCMSAHSAANSRALGGFCEHVGGVLALVRVPVVEGEEGGEIDLRRGLG